MKWFIADLHLGHSKVLIGPRANAFPTIEEWNDGILDTIRSSFTEIVGVSTFDA